MSVRQRLAPARRRLPRRRRHRRPLPVSKLNAPPSQCPLWFALRIWWHCDFHPGSFYRVVPSVGLSEKIPPKRRRKGPPKSPRSRRKCREKSRAQRRDSQSRAASSSARSAQRITSRGQCGSALTCHSSASQYRQRRSPLKVATQNHRSTALRERHDSGTAGCQFSS
jgi:hypothetical protein